jgi:hypothetical protein
MCNLGDGNDTRGTGVYRPLFRIVISDGGMGRMAVVIEL